MFEFPQFSKHSVKNDVLSGLTVALALVPEAVAFAFVAGVDPMVGLYAALSSVWLPLSSVDAQA
ncbi:sulfate permease [Vibrio maritimus]|uniref:Sulfate permease n=1 Tax=Vibrio maritimus TaxID=990268 RepID=A0A090S546_9VIBR|nr:sulfate permease [Vibrio maritimus]